LPVGSSSSVTADSSLTRRRSPSGNFFTSPSSTNRLVRLSCAVLITFIKTFSSLLPIASFFSSHYVHIFFKKYSLRTLIRNVNPSGTSMMSMASCTIGTGEGSLWPEPRVSTSFLAIPIAWRHSFSGRQFADFVLSCFSFGNVRYLVSHRRMETRYFWECPVVPNASDLGISHCKGAGYEMHDVKR
jgi:hypothetical protein